MQFHWAAALLVVCAATACGSSTPEQQPSPTPQPNDHGGIAASSPAAMPNAALEPSGGDGGGGGNDASLPPSAPAPMPLVSEQLPAFASHGDPTGAVDADYGSTWRTNHVPTSSSPDWLAIDLSSVPQAQRSTLYSVWFNELGYNYDTSDGMSYQLAGDFEIQANAAAGGGSPPSSGWVTLVSVKSNELSSRANLLSFAGYSWIRFWCTASAPNAAAQNTDLSLQWNLYDAHIGNDGWKFSGDSITANALGHQRTNDSVDQLVHQQIADDPAFEMAGHGGWSTSTLLGAIDAELADFPGLYFAIPLGTNDAGNDPVGYAGRMTQLIDTVLAAGKIPVVPTIPYTGDPGHAAIPQYNAQIQALYTKYGAKLMRGPDLYTVLYNGRAQMFDHATDLHPNATGNAAIRQAWAAAMLKNAYGQ